MPIHCGEARMFNACVHFVLHFSRADVEQGARSRFFGHHQVDLEQGIHLRMHKAAHIHMWSVRTPGIW